MGHTRILTLTDGNERYSVDGWESTNCSPMTKEWKYPAKVKRLSDGHRLDRWETADNPRSAFANMDDYLEVAIEGLERLIIEHGIQPDEIVVTRNADFSAARLESKIDVDAEIVNSRTKSIRK